MKPHLSASQLTMLSRCGEMYRWRYVEGIIAPPGVALIVGSGTHKAVECDLDSKLHTASLLDEAAVQELAADATRAAWDAQEVSLSDDELARGPDAVRGEAVDMAVSLATLHHQEVAPGIEPIALESKFRLELEGYDYDLVGIKDVVTPDAVRDTKTANKSPSGDEAALSLQLSIYHMDEVANGRRPDVALDYLVKGKRPKAVTLRATRDRDDHARVLRRIELATRVIETGSFVPTNADNWWCSKRWCGYWEACPFGSRKSVSVAMPGVRAVPVENIVVSDTGEFGT